MLGLPSLLLHPSGDRKVLPRTRQTQVLVLYPILCCLVFTFEYASSSPINALERTPVGFLIIELLKLAFTLFTRWRHSRLASRSPSAWAANADEDQYSLNDINEQNGPLRGGYGTPSKQYLPHAVGMAVVSAVTAFLLALSYNLSYGATKIQTAVALSPILVFLVQCCFLSRPFSNTIFQTLVLQYAGALVAASALFSAPSPNLLVLPLVTSLAGLAISFCYRSHPSVSFTEMNTAVFIVSTLIHTVIILYNYATGAGHISKPTSPLFVPLLPLRAAADLCALYLIYNYDASLAAVLQSLGLIALAFNVSFRVPLGVWFGVLGGSVINFWASSSYLGAELRIQTADGEAYEFIPNQESFVHKPDRFRKAAGAALVATLGAMCFLFPLRGAPKIPTLQTYVWSEECTQGRRLLAFPPPANRTYHHFDDVLLIVFFSHARYDVNLDHYRIVYADYFPNIVFVGPATREDGGFQHSYDVLVDSYQSDEDLHDVGYYKMAGRMAHHMLYTALREYPCYKGYLWAPFDTLLNVPRLEKFDQSHFWYHSPFGKYVPNVALGSPEENQDPARHPPPANLSPDPFKNLTEGWRGWGVDWWWGDPHVGVGVCMPAFLKTPQEQRDRLSLLMEGQIRLVGGSADTLYIPAVHRKAFMETLALFLETDCFLEIAVPTTVHLVLPIGEDILYVDHHWKKDPPYTANFVRKKWEAGFEVDSFHTFHWGEVDADGVWRGNPRLIDDTKSLLQESAARQGTVLPL